MRNEKLQTTFLPSLKVIPPSRRVLVKKCLIYQFFVGLGGGGESLDSKIILSNGKLARRLTVRRQVFLRHRQESTFRKEILSDAETRRLAASESSVQTVLPSVFP